MKFLLTIFTIISFSSLCAEEPIKIYLCARLSKAAKEWNNEVSKELPDYELFRPQDFDIDPLPEIEKDWAAYQFDIKGMENADLLLALTPYGRDCAWEIGWFGGMNKPSIIYSEVDGDWIRDAMVKGGISAVVTNNSTVFEKLSLDPATSSKCYFIESKKELGAVIKNIFHSLTNRNN